MSSSAVGSFGGSGVRHTVGSLPDPDDVITVFNVSSHAVSDVVPLISHTVTQV